MRAGNNLSIRRKKMNFIHIHFFSQFSGGSHVQHAFVKLFQVISYQICRKDTAFFKFLFRISQFAFIGLNELFQLSKHLCRAFSLRLMLHIHLDIEIYRQKKEQEEQEHDGYHFWQNSLDTFVFQIHHSSF